jgi:hypothetical protein
MLNDSAIGLSEPSLFRYSLWGHHVVSEIDLGEIDQVQPGSGSQSSVPALYCKMVSHEDQPLPLGRPIFDCHNTDGDLWLAFSRCEDSYVASFPGLCSFHIMPNERRIEFAPVLGIAPSTITHLLLDHAIPRFLSLQTGYLVLHASSVLVDGQAVAIIGQSGDGKSTLATYLASNGSSLLTDDCLVLRKDESDGKWLAEPGYASVRLWSDSSEALGIDDDALTEFAHYTDKRRTSRSVNMRHARHRTSLAACFVLSPATESGQPVIKPLTTGDSLWTLVQAVFRLDPANPELNRREFGALMDVMASVRLYSLSYERDYALLPAVREAIMETIQGS